MSSNWWLCVNVNSWCQHLIFILNLSLPLYLSLSLYLSIYLSIYLFNTYIYIIYTSILWNCKYLSISLSLCLLLSFLLVVFCILFLFSSQLFPLSLVRKKNICHNIFKHVFSSILRLYHFMPFLDNDALLSRQARYFIIFFELLLLFLSYSNSTFSVLL